MALATLIGTCGAFHMRSSSRTGARSSLQMFDEERSIALPFDKRPPALDGTLAGDAGFDPAGFTNNLPFEGLIGGETRSLKWYREAEIVHGRVAQLAVVGQLFPS